MSTDDEKAPADAALMFDLMQTQRRRTQSRLVRRYAWLLLVWAAAWGVGFTALWFGRDIGGVPVLPAIVAWIVFAACMVIAIVWSIVTGIRSGNSGIRGRSVLQGTLYGWSWTISMVGAWFLTVGLQRAGLAADVATLLYPALYIFLVGVLYLAGGALWRSIAQYVLGVVMIAVVIVATFIGAPWHFLVYATLGPVAMIVGSFLLWRGILPAESPEPRRASAADAAEPREHGEPS